MNIAAFLMVVTTDAQDKATFVVQPYLQNASPTEMTMMWETLVGEESTVEYGTSPKLGMKATGHANDINFSESRIHEVKITGFKTFYSLLLPGENRCFGFRYLSV